jgi:allophanate hydrolase subunit 1
MNENDLFTSTIQRYESTGSVKSTAKALGVSEHKVRKILISAGAYSTQSSEEVCSLAQKGLTTQQIADLLDCSPSWVSSLLPYDRCVYNITDASDNAQRIRQWRKDKKETNDNG